MSERRCLYLVVKTALLIAGAGALLDENSFSRAAFVIRLERTMQPSTNATLPLESLLPAIARLKTEQLRLFVIRYLESNCTDLVGATKSAYPKCAAAKNPARRLQIRGRQLLARRSVRKILDLHFNRSPFESTLDEVRVLLARSLRLNRKAADRKRWLAALSKLSVTMEKYVNAHEKISE
jgi:hypothetical protein